MKMRESEYEKKLNIETEGFQFGFPRDVKYHRYEPTPYAALEQLFETYPFDTEGRFIDFGSGKGRVPIYVHSRLRMDAIGIEMDPKFFIEAEHNKEEYLKVSKDRKAQIDFYHMIAEDYSISEQDKMFFFFNPFSVHVFRQVVQNIIASFEQYEREMYILLYYPTEDYLYYLSYETPFEEVLEMRLKGKRNLNERIIVYKLS